MASGAATVEKVKEQTAELVSEMARFASTPLSDYEWGQLLKYAPDHVVRNAAHSRPAPLSSGGYDMNAGHLQQPEEDLLDHDQNELDAEEELEAEAPVNNGRTVGIILDRNNETERHVLKMPDFRTDLTNEVMELVEQLGTMNHKVSYKAWDHLLVYVPQHDQLKKELKKANRKLRKIRKTVR